MPRMWTILISAWMTALPAVADSPVAGIGYTHLRTNVPGGRQPNIATMRARVVRVDGNGDLEIAPSLIDDPNAWTQFGGWTPDGARAIVYRGWEDSANARWEEEHRQFRMEKGQWSLDGWFIDPATGEGKNLTAVERVSHYNGGIFFFPGGERLGFTALVEGISKPFVMDQDGKNKRDVSGDGKGFTYGYSASPDGRRISYHENYQIYLADADGSNKQRIETGHPFNFAPQWSPDGQWLLFTSGEHGHSNPYVVRRDGNGLRKLADLGGYKGWMAFLDVPDYHNGSSDLPVWSTDGLSVFYSAQVGTNVELFQIELEGEPTQLTHSKPGTLHYHPQPSPDGKWLAYGSKRDGVRQLYRQNLSDDAEQALTQVSAGEAALWVHWQPTRRAP